MNITYEKLPLVDKNAPEVESRRSSIAKTTTAESINQDSEDAEKIINNVNLGEPVRHVDKLEADEKYLIDTDPEEPSKAASMVKGGLRKPHYTRLLVLGNKMVFQAACCFSLKVIAASLDSNMISGRVLYNTHSENEGGKLVYEIQGKGSELIIDVRRGDSTRAQRLFFRI
ncbi:MAG: hypothetical protein ACYSTS_15095 [Planctomycetota bacterium]|jgi:hypothetical protein